MRKGRVFFQIGRGTSRERKRAHIRPQMSATSPFSFGRQPANPVSVSTRNSDNRQKEHRNGVHGACFAQTSARIQRHLRPGPPVLRPTSSEQPASSVGRSSDRACKRNSAPAPAMGLNAPVERTRRLQDGGISFELEIHDDSFSIQQKPIQSEAREGSPERLFGNLFGSTTPTDSIRETMA